MFGFLLGATTAGAGMYYYVIDEYRVSNELLTEDIYVRLPNNLVFTQSQSVKAPHRILTCIQALQSAVQRIESYVKTLEEKVDVRKK